MTPKWRPALPKWRGTGWAAQQVVASNIQRDRAAVQWVQGTHNADVEVLEAEVVAPWVLEADVVELDERRWQLCWLWERKVHL